MTPVTTVPMSLTRELFKQSAQPIHNTIAGMPVTANTKEFSTGTLGFYGNGKITLNIGGVPVKCTVDLKIYVDKSKELPKS